MNTQPIQLDLINRRTLLLTVSQTPDLQCQGRLWALQRALYNSSTLSAHLQELVIGMGNMLVRTSTPAAMIDLEQGIRKLWPDCEPVQESGRTHEIPVRYGNEHGPDLPVLAAASGMSIPELIACHADQDYQVYCLGFQPGFAYLGDLPTPLQQPRRNNPRARVPAGSVAVAGTLTGIYPADSPGGWYIIGHTDVRLFDVTASSPSLLQPGDRVRFIPV